MTEIGEILKETQVEALAERNIVDEHSVRAASDEELILIDGIGAATVLKLREWSVTEVAEGDAISSRYLGLRCDNETLDVAPGDIIPARFGAAKYVERGKASWE